MNSHVDGTMENDARSEKYSFIEKTTQMRESFNFAHPVEIIQAMKVYSCDHYGAMLWDLQGNMANQVFRVWNTAIKLAWGLPRQCHNYFLSLLSGGTVSARKDVIGRYASFVKKLKVSSCPEVAVLCNIVSRDMRSQTGRNVKFVQDECGGLCVLSSSLNEIRTNIDDNFAKVPDVDTWRVAYLAKLLEERRKMFYNGCCVEEISSLIESLSTK